MLGLLSLLAITQAPLVLHIDDFGDLSGSEAQALKQDLVDALSAQLGQPPLQSNSSPGACGDASDCAKAIRVEHPDADVLVVRAFDAVTRIRLLLSLWRADAPPSSSEVEVSTDRTVRVTVLREHFESILPRPRAAQGPAIMVPSPAPAAPKSGSWLPWALAGAGVAAVGVGTVFGILSAGARSDIDDRVLYGHELRDVSDQMNRDAKIANFCFLGGGAGLISGAVLLLID